MKLKGIATDLHDVLDRRNSDWRRDSSRHDPARMKKQSPEEGSWVTKFLRKRRKPVSDYFQNSASPRRMALAAEATISLKRNKKRLVAKNGERNIIQTDIKRRGQSFLADIFVTLIDIRWRYILLMFLSGFILSWLGFAFLWWIIGFAHGDFDHFDELDWVPCVAEVEDFTTALLFSIETQHTIGYGTRQTTSKCPEAIVLMMFQSCIGTLMQAILTGIVFSKIQRPKRRSQTLLFSKNVVICMREGKLCLLLRVGDMRRSHMIGATIRAIKVKKSVTKEGEVLPLFEQDVAFHVPPNGNLLLVWPVMACHIIDQDSPFYNISAEDLQRDKFELIVILEGTIESTGMSAQARTSYLPSEILWGHRFRRLTMYQKDGGEYQIRYNNFHATVPVDTPLCSAKTMEEHPEYINYTSENEETILPIPSELYPAIPNFNAPTVKFSDIGDDITHINDANYDNDEVDEGFVFDAPVEVEYNTNDYDVDPEVNLNVPNDMIGHDDNVGHRIEGGDARRNSVGFTTTEQQKPPYYINRAGSNKLGKTRSFVVETLEDPLKSTFEGDANAEEDSRSSINDNVKPQIAAKNGIMRRRSDSGSLGSGSYEKCTQDSHTKNGNVNSDIFDINKNDIDKTTEENTLRNQREITPTDL